MAYYADGNHRSTVLPDRALLAQATGQRQPYQSARNQCDSVRGRARLQMARVALAIRQLPVITLAADSASDAAHCTVGILNDVGSTQTAHQCRR